MVDRCHRNACSTSLRFLFIRSHHLRSTLPLALFNFFISFLLFPHTPIGGVDREDLARPSLKLTEEEEMADKVRVKSYGDVDMVLGRRKNGECSTSYASLFNIILNFLC